MDPQRAIAALDAALTKIGEDITIERLSLSGGVQSVQYRATVRAKVNLDDMPRELVSGAGPIQQDITVIMSPSGLDADGDWPDGVDGDPRKNDRIVRNGRNYTVMLAVPKDILGEVVRYDIKARGGPG